MLEVQQNLLCLEVRRTLFSHLLYKQHIKQILHYTQNASTTTNEKPGLHQFLRNVYNL